MGINERTKSLEAYERACRVIPGGVNSPVRALRSVGATPPFIRHADGACITDIDGNDLIDLCMSWGVFILGHNNPHVNRKAIQALQHGSSYGIPTEAETTLAEQIRQSFPSMQRIRFVNSGTEATMSAVRLARGFTGRDTIVKFEGNYHGHADHLLVTAGSGVAHISSAASAGIPADFTKHTVSLPYNDTTTLEQLFSKHGNHIAAVILEPVAANMGVVTPSQEFLEATRRLTKHHGALLIFDEVITGFRLSPGGAQQRFHITPDITTLGKIIGGGYPAAAFGGRADIMELLAPLGPVYQAGTLSGNPVAMAAGSETLRQLATPHFYDNLEKKCRLFFSQLHTVIQGKDIQLNHCGSMFTLFFNPQPVRNFNDALQSSRQRFAHYFHRMLQHGIYIPPSQFEANFISAAHNDNILQHILQSIKQSIE